MEFDTQEQAVEFAGAKASPSALSRRMSANAL
jgi:hypothetical protein